MLFYAMRAGVPLRFLPSFLHIFLGELYTTKYNYPIIHINILMNLCVMKGVNEVGLEVGLLIKIDRK